MTGFGGDAGNNRVVGGSGADSLTGDAGRDRLQGGSGGDTLNGGVDDDRPSGGKEGDLHQVDRGAPGAGWGLDTIRDNGTKASYQNEDTIGFRGFYGPTKRAPARPMPR